MRTYAQTATAHDEHVQRPQCCHTLLDNRIVVKYLPFYKLEKNSVKKVRCFCCCLLGRCTH